MQIIDLSLTDRVDSAFQVFGGMYVEDLTNLLAAICRVPKLDKFLFLLRPQIWDGVIYEQYLIFGALEKKMSRSKLKDCALAKSQSSSL